MTISLHPDQETWLKARVASGDFASVEAAAQQLLDERIAERALEDDDLAWMKPLVDEGIAALERGDVLSLEEHRARNKALLDSLRG